MLMLWDCNRDRGFRHLTLSQRHKIGEEIPVQIIYCMETTPSNALVNLHLCRIVELLEGANTCWQEGKGAPSEAE